MLTKLDTACNFLDIYQPPVGICRLTVLGGNGFQVEERALRENDIPDCYVTLAVGDGTYKSKTVKNSLAPIWNETIDFVLCDYDQIVRLEVFDKDEGTIDSDDYLGYAESSVGGMLLHSGRRVFQIQDEDKKTTGAAVTVACELLKLTPELDSITRDAASPHEICGMLTIIITQAFELPMKKEDVSACVQVTCGKHKFTTSTVTFYPGVDVVNPFFDAAFHLPLTADVMQKNGKVSDVLFDLLNKETSLGKQLVFDEK